MITWTKPMKELLQPVRCLCPMMLTTVTLAITVAIVFQSVGAAVVQSTGASIPYHSGPIAAAQMFSNTTVRSSKSLDSYWARFGRNKTIAKTNKKKEGPEPPPKPFSQCETISEDYVDEVNPEEDNLDLEIFVDEIIVHLAMNDSILTDPSNLRPRIYRRKAASSLLKELREEDNLATEENDESTPEISVAKTPNVSSSPKTLDVTVKEGARVRLVCNVTGVPDYWVEWRRWSNLTFPGGEEVVGGRSVLFDQVGREDSGNYHCTVRTKDGLTHSATLRLYVNFMPEVFVWARGGGASGEVELGCLAQGYPQPQLAWYINNTRITNTVCPRGLKVSVGRRYLAPEWSLLLLRVQGLSAPAHGFYHCSATNTEARSQAVIMLHQGDLSLEPLRALSIQHNLNLLREEMKETAKNQMSVFVMGMVPPMYIAFYIIVYLSCYKSQSIVGAATGRYGGDTSDSQYSAGYPMD